MPSQVSRRREPEGDDDGWVPLSLFRPQRVVIGLHSRKTSRRSSAELLGAHPQRLLDGPCEPLGEWGLYHPPVSHVEALGVGEEVREEEFAPAVPSQD